MKLKMNGWAALSIIAVGGAISLSLAGQHSSAPSEANITPDSQASVADTVIVGQNIGAKAPMATAPVATPTPTPMPPIIPDEQSVATPATQGLPWSFWILWPIAMFMMVMLCVTFFGDVGYEIECHLLWHSQGDKWTARLCRRLLSRFFATRS